MKISFLGGALEIGRSATLVESGEIGVLMDCGVKMNQEYKFPLLQGKKKPAAIALTHAHLDHSGYVPALLEKETLPVISAFPTIPLTMMLLEDAMKVMKLKNRTPYFSRNGLKKTQKHFIGLPYEKDYEFYDGSSLQLIDAGHIPGSSQVLFRTKEGNVLYTGDMNSGETNLQTPAKNCKEHVKALVMESTYGQKDHPDRKKLENEFCRSVREAVERNYTVLLPCFAVHRTQELLLMLNAYNKDLEVVVDGMGWKATEIMLEFPNFLRDARKLENALGMARKIEGHERGGNLKGGKVIIATSGMMEGGPVINYLRKIERRKTRSKIFLTGYQVEGSNGRKLLDEGTIRVNGKKIMYTGEVRSFDFSAHSGRKELIEYAKKTNAEKVFCVHGDEESCKSLSNALKSEGMDASAPEDGRMEIVN